MVAFDRRGLVALVLLGLLAAKGRAGATDDARILREALEAYDRGVAAQVAGRADEARRALQEAAGGFEALLERGYRNASLEYNLANAYLRLDRLGLAILHYRRALRLAPRDADVRANLALARKQVVPQIEPSGRRALLERLLIFRDWAAAPVRWRTGLIVWTLGWLAAAIGLIRRGTGWGAAAAVCLLVGAAVQLELLADLHDQQRRPPAVVVGTPVELRQGRGEAYEPVLSEPLGPGVELRAIERRGDWVRVRLVSDVEGWLPVRAIGWIGAGLPAAR